MLLLPPADRYQGAGQCAVMPRVLQSSGMSKQIAFGDIVVVEGDQIGVVVKVWGRDYHDNPPLYEVYVRNYRTIKEYYEPDVDRYLVRHKELDEEEIEYQANGVNL